MYSDGTIDALAICNTILPTGTQHYIEKAAAYEGIGNRTAAEACRQAAGYDGVSNNDKGEQS